MRAKHHMPGIAMLLAALMTFASLQAEPALAGQDLDATSLAPASAQTDDGIITATAPSTDEPDKLFGLPWSSLPFVTRESQDSGQGTSPGVTVSERTALTERFSPPATYQGKHFSTATVTGASINASNVITITIPREALNHSDDKVKHLLAATDAKREELGLSSSASNKVSEYCTSYASHSTQILNLAIIQSCLDYAHDHYENDTLYRIALPAGTYEIGAPALNECLHIYSNTWLDMTAGTKLVHLGRKTCMMRNSKADDNLSGYENHDIVLDGGTWIGLDSPTTSHDEVALCHAKNIVVRNAVFDGCSGAHHLELVGVSNATIMGCEFKGFAGATAKEAIQLDIAGPASASTFKKSDYTTTRNVVICNNSFRDLSRGIGTHYAYLGYLNSEILIQNNSFDHLEYEAILLVSFKNVAIVRNKVQNCPQAVHILPALDSPSRYSKTGKPYITCKNYLIEGNDISTGGSTSEIWGAITIYGNKVGSTTYALKNAVLKNNVVKASNVALTLSRTSNIIATGETYESAGSYSALVYKAARASFSRSSFRCTSGAGISAQSQCDLALKKCTACNCKTAGIAVQDATLAATSCTLSKNGHHGLTAAGSSLALKSCTFSKNKRYGIFVSESELSASKGVAKSNGKDGMRFVDSTVKILKLKSYKNRQCGIRAIWCTARISKCRCSKNRAHGASLQRSLATVKTCTFKQNKKNGLSIVDKTKITTMKGNSFTRNERYGVYGSDKSKVGKQSGNSYSKNGKGSYHMPIAKKHTAPAT